MSYTIGSLFDGSGGFPLAGSLCGIVPAWAAEIEPYPIAVTRSRFPGMRHLGDISKVNGAEIEPVDIITFGSPCQNMSQAGNRAGIKHTAHGDEKTTESGLFYEAVRIIKEMREATNGVYPKIALWENVPGAFTSNKGEDFRTVLEELIKIVEPDAVMPPVPKAGWAYADSYSGDGWSLAYRVFDTQYWPGTPQRRRRIHLVLHLAGQCATKILFERAGLRGSFATGRMPWQATTADFKNDTGAADCTRKCIAYSFDSLASNSMKSSNPNSGCRQVEIAKTLDCFDPNPSKNQGGIAVIEPIPYTLKIRSGCEGGGKGALVQTNKSATLKTCNDQYLFQPVYCLQRGGNGGPAKQNGSGVSENISYTLTAEKKHGVCYQDTEAQYIARKLTPTEYARLQGFADWWGHIEQKERFSPEEYAFWLEVRNTHAVINGKAVKEYTEQQMLTWYNKLHTDSAEYKMWGNGIALPPALYCMQGIVDALNKGGREE